MIGKQRRNTDQVQCVSTEALVPTNHVLRRLHAALDLSFVRERVAPFYSEIGRRSVDPEVVARIWILQQFYGYSEREVCDELRMHAGFRWFCGLSFNDPVPDQSTLVKLRTEKWAESGLWKALLDETVRACEAAGICRGQRVGIDGTQIDANAAIVSLEALPPELRLLQETAQGQSEHPPGGSGEVAPPGGASGSAGSVAEGELSTTPAPPAGLERSAKASQEEGSKAGCSSRLLRVEAGGNPRGQHKSGDPDWRGEHFSNATHRSTTDPEARLYRKSKGQEAKLRYLGHYMADLPSGVIYGAMATQATGTAEREAARQMLKEAVRKPKQAAMDLGYRDGEFLADLEACGVQPIVPLGKEALEELPTWQRRTFDAQRYQQRQRAVAAAQARNNARLLARGRYGVAAMRQRTRLEHLIGEGKEHHGLSRAQGRGVERVDQQVKLTAVVQNLKRLLAGLMRRRRGSSAPEAMAGWNTLDLRGRVPEGREAGPPLPGTSLGIQEPLGHLGSEGMAERGRDASTNRHGLLARLLAKNQRNARRPDRANDTNSLGRSLTLQHVPPRLLLARIFSGLFSSRF